MCLHASDEHRSHSTSSPPAGTSPQVVQPQNIKKWWESWAPLLWVTTSSTYSLLTLYLAYLKPHFWETSHSVVPSILLSLLEKEIRKQVTLCESIFGMQMSSGAAHLGGLSPRWENPQDQLWRGQQCLHREQDSSNGYYSNCTGKFPLLPWASVLHVLNRSSLSLVQQHVNELEFPQGMKGYRRSQHKDLCWKDKKITACQTADL